MVLRAIEYIGSESAFSNPSLEITPSTVGTVSAFHAASGVFAVRALVDRAFGDSSAAETAVHDYVAWVDGACHNLDLTLGTSSIVLAHALLFEATRSPVLEKSGTATREMLLAMVASLPPVGTYDPRLPYLGIAHGIAGVLYSILRWSEATDVPVAGAAERRLHELAGVGHTAEGATRWPVDIADHGGREAWASGWCHGSAGYVFLWTLASRLLAEPKFLSLASQAARATLAARPTNVSLCCGLAGQAFSLLSLHRVTGSEEWLEGAHSLAASARRAEAIDAAHRYSLYKGQLGVAVLLSDLGASARSAMPFFESEASRQTSRATRLPPTHSAST